MGSLSVLKVLNSLHREVNQQKKRGNNSEQVQYSAIVIRMANEYPHISYTILGTLVSKYLKKALKEGFIDKEKKGRKVFYWITEEGKDHLISNQDQLDDARIWLEDPVFGGYLSYAIAPKGTPLICETRDEDSLSGKDKIRELMKLIKEENPDLETIKIRFDSTDDSFTD